MDLLDLLRILARRWYIVLGGAVVTVALAATVVQLVPATYTATSSVLVFRKAAVLGPDGNPFVALGGLEGARDIVLKAMNDPAVRKQLITSSSEELEVVADAQSSAPVVSVTVTASSPEAALRLQSGVLALVPTTLSRVQDDLGVAPAAQVASVVLSKSAEAESSRKNQLRALIATVVIGALLTLLGAVAFDRWRRGRRSDLPAEESTEDDTAATDPPARGFVPADLLAAGKK